MEPDRAAGRPSLGPPGSAPPAGVRRLHPASLLFDAGRRFFALATWGLAVLFFAARAEQAWYLLFLLPPIVEALVRYVSFRYALEGDRLEIRGGVFVRNVRHVPYARIQNIDTVQGPLHRLLGVVEVRLETAAGKEPEAVFRVISTDQLAELRAGVFGAPARPRTADEAWVAAAEAEPGWSPALQGEAAFFRMKSSDVLLFGLSAQRGLVLVGGAFVALREFAAEFGLEERLHDPLEQASEGARALGPGSWILLLLGVFLLLQAGTILWAFLTLHDFRIERKGEDLRTTCGLLTRQTASLPRSRVQFLDVRQSWVQRLLGRVAVRALSAGGDSTEDSQVSRKWLVPLCRKEELPAILSEVQPEAALEGLEWRPVHPGAVRRLFVRWSVVLALAALPAWWHSPVLGAVASAAALGLGLFLARLRARALGWALGRHAIFLRDGLFGRRLACVRFEKIQAIDVTRSPLDRRAGMARVGLDTAGSTSSVQRFVVPFLGLRAAGELARALRREAAAVSFRW
jgi:putative membrane protein